MLHKHLLRCPALYLLLLLIVPVPAGLAQDDPTATTLPAATTAEPASTATPTAIPTPTRPQPFQTIERDGVMLEVLFNQIPQGGVGVLHLTGDNVAGARLRFRNQLGEFYPVDGDGFYGLVAVNMDQASRVYEMSVLVWFEDSSEIVIPLQANVTLGGFIRQDFDLSADRAYLADPQIERSEFARLDSILDDVTLERYWAESGFQPPVVAELTSPFGAFRIINHTVETRHTGWDMTTPTGTPVLAIADGVVAYAGAMDIRGNHVIVDHGYGVYSGYSHMSQIHVTRGQEITRGQVVGMTGNTGRSNGPHMHWEMAVNGEWVDSVDFILTWIP